MNKVICITGAGSGIGLEIAKRFAASNTLVLIDLKFSAEVKKEFAQSKVFYYKADVTNPLQLKKAFQKHKKIDMAFHCAGLNFINIFENVPLAEFKKVIEINLIGSFNFAQAVLPSLQQGSRLILTASMAGLVTNYSYTSYSSSKFAVVGLASVLRTELKLKGIQVHVVCPPEVDTPMVEREYHKLPKAAQKLKLKAGRLQVDEAVDGILKQVMKNKFIVIPGIKARIVYYLIRFVPLPLQHFITDRTLAKELVKEEN